MTWQETAVHRSVRRMVLGVITIILGIISMVGFFSIYYIAGIAILGGSFSFILIALGLGLILQKTELEEN